MKIVSNNPDAVIRRTADAEAVAEIFCRRGGEGFLPDPSAFNAAGFHIGRHSLRFGAGFVAALSAGDNY